MTRDDVKKLFFMTMAVYPTFYAKADDGQLSMAIDGWWMALQDLPFAAAQRGLNAHVKQCKWPPTPHEIREAGAAKLDEDMLYRTMVDEEYRRLNPTTWHKGKAHSAQRTAWLKEHNRLPAGRKEAN